MSNVNARNILLYLSHKYNGNWERIFEAVRDKEPMPIDGEFDNIINNISGEEAITILDSDYPMVLKERDTLRPPFVIYIKGNKELLNEHNKLCVAGTRNPTDYSKIATDRILSSLTNEITLVTNFTGLGTAVQVAEQCLKGKKVIGVLPYGFNYVRNPKEKELLDTIAEKGLIISEYPPNEPISAENCVARNRISAILSDKIFVPEAKDRSGTMITLNFALNKGKDIMVLPHPFNDATKNNELIKEGAFLVENHREIEEMFNIQAPVKNIEQQKEEDDNEVEL